jgi:hypothetical protein
LKYRVRGLHFFGIMLVATQENGEAFLLCAQPKKRFGHVVGLIFFSFHQLSSSEPTLKSLPPQ